MAMFNCYVSSPEGNNKRNSKKQWMIGPAMVLIGEAWNMWLIVVAERSNFEMFSQRQSGKLDTKQAGIQLGIGAVLVLHAHVLLSFQSAGAYPAPNVRWTRCSSRSRKRPHWGEGLIVPGGGWLHSNKDFGATGMLILLGIHWDFSWDFMGNTWDLLRWQAMLL